jgi:ribonuclease VapC
MVIDASALVAILTNEAERDIFERAIARADVRRMSPVNWFETATVLGSRSLVIREALDSYVKLVGIDITPADAQQADLADHARRIYGRGRHLAQLNLGDCFAYALAKSTGESLLFKGNDFTHTDIVPAL